MERQKAQNRQQNIEGEEQSWIKDVTQIYYLLQVEIKRVWYQ